MIDLSDLKPSYTSSANSQLFVDLGKAMTEWCKVILPLYEIAEKNDVNCFYTQTILWNKRDDPNMIEYEGYRYEKNVGVNVGVSYIRPYQLTWDEENYCLPIPDWQTYFEKNYHELDFFDRTGLHAYTFRLRNREAPYDELGKRVSEELKALTGNPKAGISFGGYTVIARDIDTYYEAFDKRYFKCNDL